MHLPIFAIIADFLRESHLNLPWVSGPCICISYKGHQRELRVPEYKRKCQSDSLIQPSWSYLGRKQLMMLEMDQSAARICVYKLLLYFNRNIGTFQGSKVNVLIFRHLYKNVTKQIGDKPQNAVSRMSHSSVNKIFFKWVIFWSYETRVTLLAVINIWHTKDKIFSWIYGKPTICSFSVIFLFNFNGTYVFMNGGWWWRLIVPWMWMCLRWLFPRKFN